MLSCRCTTWQVSCSRATIEDFIDNGRRNILSYLCSPIPIYAVPSVLTVFHTLSSCSTLCTRHIHSLPAGRPLHTRQLLYTAVTRAKKLLLLLTTRQVSEIIVWIRSQSVGQ